MKKLDTIATADKLIELRKANGYTQDRLAETLDIAKNSVAKWERMICMPRYETLVRLTELYGCTFNDILITKEI